MRLRLEPVTIASVEDGEGILAYWNGRLVAVLVRLSDDHDKQAGGWFVEKAFGALDRPIHPTFATLDEARAWLASEMADRPVGSPYERRPRS